MAIHCEPVSEQSTPFASFETRWIAASLTSFFSRNDNDVERIILKHKHALLSSRGRSPWRSTVSKKANRQAVRDPQDTMDCRVVLPSSSQYQKEMGQSVKSIKLQKGKKVP